MVARGYSISSPVQVPIQDVYGPTAWDEDLQCLVVTADTVKGGEMVNKERERKVSLLVCVCVCHVYTDIVAG